MHLVLVAVCVFAQSSPTSAELTNPNEWNGNPPAWTTASSSFQTSPAPMPASECAICRCPVCGGGMTRRHCWRIKPTGDLFPHMAYDARPKMYYYFRPYSPSHIRQQAQGSGALVPLPPVPESNVQFQNAYESVESQFRR